jgi:8-oxo-dGTP diphosphatase
MIAVVAGIIVRQGRVLLIQRSPGTRYGWCWASPGGKVEEGESLIDALVREMREEVGLLVHARRLFLQVPFADAPSPFCVTFYVVDVGEQVPVAGDGVVGFGWFSARDFERNAVELTPANAAIRTALVRWLEGR